MIAMIDDFEFEITKMQFDSISHEISWNYAQSKRIGNSVKTQAVGKSDESFSFSGVLILQKLDSFEKLITIADKQKPVSLSFTNEKQNESILVTIQSIKRDMSIFLKTGEYVKQGFSITLKRWYR